MKRTKNQKVKASASRVNSQLTYTFNQTYSSKSENKQVDITDKSDYLASIRKELFRSLLIASMILISLLVIYWVS